MTTRAISQRDTTRESWRMVLTLVSREVRDTLRDWRLVTPIVILTLFFPVLMSFVANMALRWVAKYGSPIIGERLIPFMLMVVGFFPISFSLVIALETFVGERERRSLEPLLATPLTDAQLYLGKTLAALIPPLLASYLGIGVYLVGLYFFKGWTAPPVLLTLMLVLTSAEALVMVSAAVVLSSQTTSVRAANLLASFIIIPMALLVQGEAIIMFYANYRVLWWIVLFLVLVDVILVRMGVRTFNREELLGREIDELNVGFLWRTFYNRLRWQPWFFGLDVDAWPPYLRWIGSITGLYLRDVPRILFRSWPAMVTVVLGLVGAWYVGYHFAVQYRLPPEMLKLDAISFETFSESPTVGWLPHFTVWGVLSNNIRSLLLGGLLAVFSLGTLAIALLMVPLAIVFFFTAQAAFAGYDPMLFFATFILPHGILELPASIIATAMAVRLGAAFMSPPKGGITVSQQWLGHLADFVKIFLTVVLPLLALAAVVEVHITPWVVVTVFGR